MKFRSRTMTNIQTYILRVFVTVLALGTLMASGAYAQEDATYDQRLSLAQEMHKIRPTQEQVYSAIDQIAAQQPESERETFRDAMRKILNYKAIEKASVDAMVEIYTLAELEAMVEYFAKPEAKSAAAKDDQYASKVYPEIIKMLDQAMMKVRTGN